ncbi:MAG TPA: PhoU domain-containing protein [Thermoplasmata archaeon]|nr:PhoU domain-containing protein [Thermoplasmata archaeon]
MTISLPKPWVEKFGLKQGDQVFLEEEASSLKVTPAALATRRTASPEYAIDADLCDEPGILHRVIVGNYVLGRERLVIRSTGRLKSEHLAEAREASRRLMGMGIIEETASKIVLQCSIEPTKYPVDTLVKRLYNLSSTMLDESVEALITKDRRLAEDALHREDDADMMYWLLIRLLLSAQADDSLLEQLGLRNRLEIAGYRLIAKELETVADYGEDIARNVLELIDEDVEVPTPLAKALKDLVEGVRDVYSKGIGGLLSRDLKLANQAILTRDEMKKKEQKFMRLLFEQVEEPTVLLNFRNIIDGVQRMADYGLSIAVIAFNRYLERPTNLCKPTS